MKTTAAWDRRWASPRSRRFLPARPTPTVWPVWAARTAAAACSGPSVCFSADCTPILLHDPVRRAVAAVHAGWRGTALGIAARCLEAMARDFGTDPADVEAAIGPCIGPCCFETDADVPRAILASLGPEAEPLIRREGEKYYPDLKALNALWLRRTGVRRIDCSCDCTRCRPDRFWSHRLTGTARGTMAAVILLREKEADA